MCQDLSAGDKLGSLHLIEYAAQTGFCSDCVAERSMQAPCQFPVEVSLFANINNLGVVVVFVVPLPMLFSIHREYCPGIVDNAHCFITLRTTSIAVVAASIRMRTCFFSTPRIAASTAMWWAAMTALANNSSHTH